MKIHSDVLTYANLHAATAAAGMHGVYIEGVTRHGSRSRHHAFNITLRGNSTRRPNWGTGARDTDEGYAATWDEWGMFIEALFQMDPNAIIGQYPSHAAFRAFTRNRFDWLTASQACPSHKWGYDGVRTACARGCGAEQDWSAPDRRVQILDGAS